VEAESPASREEHGTEYLEHGKDASGSQPRTERGTAYQPRTERGTAYRPLPFAGFLIYWTAANYLFWTWASEKMPWQNQHLVLTFALLGGWFLGQVWDRTDWRKLLQRGAGYALVLLPLALFSLVVLINTTRGTPRPFGGMDIDRLEVTLRWLLSLVLLITSAALIYSLARRLGWRGWLRVILAVVFVVLLAATIRVAIMTSFKNQDYASEFLVYAASTPDTAALMRELDDMARYLPPGEPLRIAYDNDSQQPFFWYLREYDNVTFFTGDSGLSGEQDVIIIGLDNEAKIKAQLAGKYVKRNYRLIWWPNEDVYRNLTLKKLWSDLRDPARRKYWWDILWWRKYPESTVQWPSVHRFSLYVRKDLAAKVWNLGPEVAITGVEIPEDEYEKKRVDVMAVASFGTAGSENGQFNDPKDLAVDSQGQMYVLDTRNHRVQVFGADGQFVRAWGSQGNGPGQFQEPWGIAVDKAGNVYVADTWNHRIEKFDSQGQFVTMWGTYGDTGGALGASDIFYGPRDIVVEPDGNLMVSDTGNKRIVKFGPDGQFLGQWGGAGSLNGQFREPCGLAVDADGNAYVADVWNQRVQKLDAQGNFVTQWPVLGWESELPVNKPYIAVDSRGDVYVTAPDYNRVAKFDGAGKLLAVWGQFGTDAKSFNVPSGIAVDATGNVYVTDSGNNRVVKFAPVN
jgi:DNA-binding beta-propeller fold protein YncE